MTQATIAERAGVEGLDLESFDRASRFLRSILNLDELLRAILEEGLAAVGGTRGFVGLINRRTGELEIRFTAGQGWDEQPVRKFRLTNEPGNGITVRVAVTGAPYVSNDVRGDPHYVMFFPDVRSEITVPLVNRDGRTIGVVNIESEAINAFSHRDLQLLGALASQASVAISVANYRAREAALIEIGSELASSSDMAELLQRVVTRSAALLRADDCSIFSLEGDRLVLAGSGELLAHRVGEITYRVGEGLTGWVAEQQAPVRVPNVRDDPRWRGLFPELPEGAIESYLAVPVFDRDGIWGVLRVLRRNPANSIVPNDFTQRDEVLLSTLARQVGAAITQRKLLDRQLQMERMAAWGEMSARSAHMIGNKVFAIKGQLNELEYLSGQPGFGREQVLEVVRRAKGSVFSLEEILAEFRDFLLATHLNRAPLDLNALLEETMCETCACAAGVTVRFVPAVGLPRVFADATKLRRAVGELLENACTHQPDGGEVCVRTGWWGERERCEYPQLLFRPEAANRQAVWLEVADKGPGVPEENKARLFDPFFTTRAKGMGLGLSIVKGIVDAHLGTIAEVGTPGGGARFLIVLPGLPE